MSPFGTDAICWACWDGQSPFHEFFVEGVYSCGGDVVHATDHASTVSHVYKDKELDAWILQNDMERHKDSARRNVQMKGYVVSDENKDSVIALLQKDNRRRRQGAPTLESTPHVGCMQKVKNSNSERLLKLRRGWVQMKEQIRMPGMLAS